MNNNFELNKKQLSLIISNLLVTKIIFVFTRDMFKTSGNAAWIQAIFITLIAVLLLEINFLFYQKTGNKSVIQLAEIIGKKPLKIIVTLLVTVILAVNVGGEMRTFAESVKIILLPNTKIEFIMILFSLVVGFGAFCGLEALGIINSLFFPFCLFFLGLLGVTLIGDLEINTIFPLFGNGPYNIFVEGLADLSCFSDILVLNILLPYCKDIEMVKKSGRRAVLTGGIVLILLCLVYGLIYPYPYSSEFLLTIYQLSRMVRAGEYFQRFEAFFELVWVIMQLLYSAIYVYIICDVLSSGFKLRYTKALIPCVVISVAILSFEPSNVVDFLDMARSIRRTLFPIAYALPVMIPAIYVISRRNR